MNKPVVAVPSISDEERAALRNGVLKDMKEAKADLFLFLAQVANGETETGWVVMMNHVNTMSFKRDNGAFPTEPKICRARNATLFSLSMAREVATCTTNGNGETGEAVRLEDAIKRQINNLISCILTLEGAV